MEIESAGLVGSILFASEFIRPYQLQVDCSCMSQCYENQTKPTNMVAELVEIVNNMDENLFIAGGWMFIISET